MLHFTPSHSCPPDNAKDCAAWKRETHGAVCEVASSPPSPTAQERFKKKLLALRGELAELERARKDQDRMLSELDVRIKALQNKHDYLRTASAEQDRKLLEQNKMLNELEEKIDVLATYLDDAMPEVVGERNDAMVDHQRDSDGDEFDLWAVRMHATVSQEVFAQPSLSEAKDAIAWTSGTDRKNFEELVRRLYTEDASDFLKVEEKEEEKGLGEEKELSQ
ncbi:hypothetical protein PC129_g18216 [Phytophthora cactorum]|uniref:Uncharacterized protein n=2 Tax=Phytophthora cactorum TaxID=29920 RepID=A0A329RMH9_9STRA|nr:hypothetical protein Pcac1_g8355 [Phytophthora cactorum]KAG2881974.1 hypothetical protein PC114_g21278 [Phytophthora cactorum]KAG2892210.1 hypothetical protein PC115_g18927 [Phytophthora cactorum]KAG3062044.1 hypothetical protein PC122_g19423 [Phytophthora cactorum]KAG3210786.1 hypothetical protein PC129_g18216 [Phytophthora cactorum]